MLNALLSQPLFLVISLACHYFSNILAEYDMCSPLLLPHHPEQDQFEKYPEDIQDLGVRFPSQLPVEFGVSAARINAN